MRPILLLLLALAVPAAARGQSGLGSVRGLVLPRDAGTIDGFGRWAAPSDTAAVARLVFRPVRTLACRDGQARREGACEARTAEARGADGRYGPKWLAMGEYRVRVLAPGCTPAERPLVVLGGESVVHVALTCRRPRR